MLTLYFSATGNTEYIARFFSKQMDAECLSIEEEADFSQKIEMHDHIAFCYPIYGSRVPRIMRKFVDKHKSDLSGKKIIILVTQMLFSGDGARVLTDLLQDCDIEVIYAEHIRMPDNVGNIFILPKGSNKKIRKYVSRAVERLQQTCSDIKNGIVIKRGFSKTSKVLGKIQGIAWQGDSTKVEPRPFSAEGWSKNRVKIHKGCTSCCLCVDICPMKNFKKENGAIQPQGDCFVCYRCINRCPEKAISVMINIRPQWQYEGIESVIKQPK